MVNTDGLVTATFPTPGGRPRYDGDTAIDGVPGTAAPVVLDFEDSSAGASVLPTGNITDVFDGITVTCVDNGMPVVVVAASSFGKTGYESVKPSSRPTRSSSGKVQELRLEAGKAMGLGDVSGTTVPKIFAGRRAGIGQAARSPRGPSSRSGCTRSIGVLGAVSVGNSRGHAPRRGRAATRPSCRRRAATRLRVEHPSGALQVEVELDDHDDMPPKVLRSPAWCARRASFSDGTVFPR